MLETKIKKSALKALENTRYGSLKLHLPYGAIHDFIGSHAGATAELIVHDWRTFSAMAVHGDTGFAEAYRDGWCDTPDIAALVQFSLENEAALEGYLHGSFGGRFIAFIGNFLRMNTVKGSRSNIRAHYDLGNDFYRLWLDPTMTYSSALFSHPQEDIVNAQHRKYDRIVERLNAPSGRILEVGCGWGGFAERALQQGDYAIKGLTLSTEQHDYAAHRLHGQPAHIALEDYRHQTGKYDFLVSIEMFEAVGERYWPVYFQKLASLMESKGKAVIQTITIGEDYFLRYRKAGDFIRRFIFPGGMLPSPSRFEEEAAKAGLQLTDSFAFGPHYARTLHYWLERFDACRSEILALGYDERFIRLWRLYLAACTASFTVGRTDVMQLELRHAV